MRGQLAMNCDEDFKRRVIAAAKRAGYRKYSPWLRRVIEEALTESEKKA